MIINYLLLVWGLIATFFLPGYLVIQGFYAYLPKYKKIPLIGAISVIISTYLLYFSLFIMGFSRYVVGMVFLFLSFAFWLYVCRQGFVFNIRSRNAHTFLLAGFIYLLFFLALAPGIMTRFNGYWVLSAVNWQDTAMHLGIMESIKEGNFPPQAPYFSGQALTYYYFSDLHTALLAFFSGLLSWQVLVWDNPFFAALFSAAIYGLSMAITRDRVTAFFAALLSVFAGSFMFLYLISDWVESSYSLHMLGHLLADKGYTLDFETIITMVPMADYFLQNRPMMVGLSVVACVLILVLEKQHWHRALFLASMLSALVFKFQLFASLVGFMAIGLGILFNIKIRSKKAIFQAIGLIILAVIPVSLWFFLSRVGDTGFFDLVVSTIRLGPWNRDAGWGWFLLFYPANLGVSLILGLVVGLISLRQKTTKKLSFIFIFSLYCILLPLVVVFTVYEWDMFKFFYFAQIGFVVLSGVGLGYLWKKKWGKAISLLLVFFASATSILTLLWSGLNKYQAYTHDQYLAGMWIKENIAPNTVFLTTATVHSPVTQIAGRLRVLSYTTWPYSHGYNVGVDNVFSRLRDVEHVYQNPGSSEAQAIFIKYRVAYVYWDTGVEKDYPGAFEKLLASGYQLKYRGGEVALFTPPDAF